MSRPDSPNPFLTNSAIEDPNNAQDPRLHVPMGSELKKTLIRLNINLDICLVISDMVCFEKSAANMERWDGVLCQLGFADLGGLRHLILSLMIQDRTAEYAHAAREERRRRLGIIRY